MAELSPEQQSAVEAFLREASLQIPYAQASMSPEAFAAELERAAGDIFSVMAVNQAAQTYTAEQLADPETRAQVETEINAAVENMTEAAAEAVSSGTLDVSTLNPEPEPMYRETPPEINIVDAPTPGAEGENMDIFEQLRLEGVAPSAFVDAATSEALFSPLNPLGDLYAPGTLDPLLQMEGVSTFYENALEETGQIIPPPDTNLAPYFIAGGALLLFLVFARKK